MFSESSQRGFLGTTRLAELGWDQTRDAAEAEIKEIQAAMRRGVSSYQLRYTAKVNKKGTFGIRLIDEAQS
ncbi:transcriptional regulator, partial [Lacticaseibacillus rhamnosus]